MLEHLVPQPEYKLLTIKNIPQISEAAMQYSTYQWQGLLKHLRQMLIADAGMEEGMLCGYCILGNYCPQFVSLKIFFCAIYIVTLI